MGPNLSGRYGDVVVQDTNETVFFSPIPDPSSRMAVIVAVTTLLAVATVALAIGSAMLAQCAAAYGLVLAVHWYAFQTGPQFTLLLRLPEHRWVIKNASPSRQQMTHGETGELKEIMLRRYFDEEGRRWVPILRWKHCYEVRNRLVPPSVDILWVNFSTANARQGPLRRSSARGLEFLSLTNPSRARKSLEKSQTGFAKGGELVDRPPTRGRGELLVR